jgi:hypothetical protein
MLKKFFLNPLLLPLPLLPGVGKLILFPLGKLPLQSSLRKSPVCKTFPNVPSKTNIADPGQCPASKQYTLNLKSSSFVFFLLETTSTTSTESNSNTLTFDSNLGNRFTSKIFVISVQYILPLLSFSNVSFRNPRK